VPATDPDAAKRHPLDPDPVRSTKATAVLALGIVAVITAPLVGGLIPALVALVLAGQARADLATGRGYLTGLRRLRAGRTLCWIALVLAATALVVASVIGILSVANAPGQDFPSTSN
jgi:hypothetical protein